MSPSKRAAVMDEATVAEDAGGSPDDAVATQAAPTNRISATLAAMESETAEEIAGSYVAGTTETGTYAADDPAKHTPVAGTGTDTEVTPMESTRATGEDSGLELVPGYAPPTENAAQDEAALPDAFMADAEVDKEFFGILATLAPVLVSTVLPIIKKRVLNRRTIRRIGSAVGTASSVANRLLGTESYEPAETEEVSEAELEAAADQLEVIIGTDDRIRIRATTQIPWRRICQLTITARNGQRFVGTGFMVGKRTVITAGHCVYIHSAGGWPAHIDVAPGRNGGARPFGAVRATAFRSVTGWVNNKSRDYDYGAIILPTGTSPVIQSLGGFGFAWWPDFQLLNRMVNLSGYPGDGGKLGPDREPASQWWMARQIKSVAARSFAYDIDTVGGQSGSPVWTVFNGQRLVLGIHTNGFVGGNSATRITRAVFDNLKLWRAQGN